MLTQAHQGRGQADARSPVIVLGRQAPAQDIHGLPSPAAQEQRLPELAQGVGVDRIEIDRFAERAGRLVEQALLRQRGTEPGPGRRGSRSRLHNLSARGGAA